MPLIQTAGLFAAGLVATTSIVAGATQGADDTDRPGDAAQVPCALAELPAELRDDLTAVRELPEGERIDALLAIRDHALDGEYGARVQRLAEGRDERVRAVRRLLPDDLKADLRAARDLSGGERVTELQDIRDGVLGGEYGDRVQQVAQAVKHRLEACETP